MNVLSLYTGAGGFDLGLEAAGFRIAGCVENDADARATIEASTRWPLIDIPVARPGDVHGLRPEQILERFGLEQRGVNLLAGGPPCQPFSKASLWVEGSTKRMLDPRAGTLHAYFGVLEAALPDVMLLENVQGITYAPRTEKTREEAMDVLNAQLERINARHRTRYAAQLLTVDAADYGVPQRRERVFVFASREGDGISMPPPTHASDPDGTQHRLATCWDAIGDLEDGEFDDALEPTGRWAALLATIPEGSNYQWHTPRGGGEPLFGWRTKYWSSCLTSRRPGRRGRSRRCPGRRPGRFTGGAASSASSKWPGYRRSQTSMRSRAPTRRLVVSLATPCPRRSASFSG